MLRDEPATLDPRIDPEALVLSALMWAPDADASRDVINKLVADDFYNPLYGQVFEIIAELSESGAPHDATSVRSKWLTAEGAPPLEISTRVMLTLIGIDSFPMLIGEYARQVAAAAYRRRYADMAKRLQEAAATAPDELLFEIMVSEGRAQRAAWTRYVEQFVQKKSTPANP